MVRSRRTPLSWWRRGQPVQTVPTIVKAAAFAIGANVLWGLLLCATEDLGLVAPLGALLFVAPALAYGLLRVRRTFFIGTMIHTIAVVAIGAVTVPFVSSGWVPWTAVAQAFVATALLLPQNVREPFLRTRAKFRAHKRYELSLKVILEGATGSRPGETIDVSAGGAYVDIDPQGFEKDSRVKIDLELREGKHLVLPARIVAIHAEGVGNKPRGVALQFTAVTRSEKALLESFVSAGRHRQRMLLALPVSFELRGQKVNAHTIDVALGGCFVQDGSGVCTAGDRVMLTLMLHDDDPLEIIGEVMWLSSADTQGKPPGFAVQFQSMRRPEVERLRERLKAAGGEEPTA
jgi:Tfp pilus assembly protein PilZ